MVPEAIFGGKSVPKYLEFHVLRQYTWPFPWTRARSYA